MTKPLTFFNETFAGGIDYANAIWQIAKQNKSINGFYLCLDDVVKSGYLGIFPETNYLTWYNMLADGNYLYGTGLTRIDSSPLFNNRPCIDFDINGQTQLLFNHQVKVGTLILVYALKEYGSYIIYAPRQTNPPEPRYYDGLPSGYDTLWQYEDLNSGSVYYAQSRINNKDVAPTTFLPLYSSRVLSVRNFASGDGKETIDGFGGQSGAIGGSDFPSYYLNSFKGQLAAVITYEDVIDIDLLSELELALGKYYVDYTGVTLTETPKFKQLIGTFFIFDFSTIAIDEWFDITDYTLIAPTNLGLSFSGSVLSGFTDSLYDGTLTISITNSNNLTNTFTFEFVVCRKDPLTDDLPAPSNLSVVLSASRNADGAYYGLKLNASNQIEKWEDARRIVPNTPVYEKVENKLCSYTASDSLFNNQGTVVFDNVAKLVSTTTTYAKTFIWVYVQTSYGTRYMLDTFPDIKGTGELWTVPVDGQTHGSTPITKLTTRIQNIQVNTLNFKNPLNTVYIITATSPDGDFIDFTGFEAMRGRLAFFAAWDTVLTDTELREAVSLLAAKYYTSLAPYIFDNKVEFRTQSPITVDLKQKVSDLRSLALIYTLTNPFYNASISTEGLLSFTPVKDEVINVSISVQNSANLTSILTFQIDVAIRPNPLYQGLKTVLGTSIVAIYLADLDTLVLGSGSSVSQWNDYRLNGSSGTGTGLTAVSLPQLNNYYALNYNINGSSSLAVSATTGRCFIIVYIRKPSSTGRAFLFGQTSLAQFLSGLDGRIWETTTATAILNGTTYVNNAPVGSSYVFSPEVVNTVFINTTSNLTINSVAKDRTLTDRSVKGYVPLWLVVNRTLTASEVALCNDYIRDYYDPPRFITLLHFDDGIVDSSASNKTLFVNASISYWYARFGVSSLELVSNSTVGYVEIVNDIEFAHLMEDFKVSFWLFLMSPLNNDDTLVLYNQTDILIYIRGNRLYVGSTTNIDLAFYSYEMPWDFYYDFKHIALVRKDLNLSFYVDGIRVGQIIDGREYRDYNSVVRIGQYTNLTTPGVYVYIDELAVYKREALHAGDSFTPPQAPYSV